MDQGRVKDRPTVRQLLSKLKVQKAQQGSSHEDKIAFSPHRVKNDHSLNEQTPVEPRLEVSELFQPDDAKNIDQKKNLSSSVRLFEFEPDKGKHTKTMLRRLSTIMNQKGSSSQKVREVQNLQELGIGKKSLCNRFKLEEQKSTNIRWHSKKAKERKNFGKKPLSKLYIRRVTQNNSDKQRSKTLQIKVPKIQNQNRQVMKRRNSSICPWDAYSPY